MVTTVMPWHFANPISGGGSRERLGAAGIRAGLSSGPALPINGVNDVASFNSFVTGGVVMSGYWPLALLHRGMSAANTGLRNRHWNTAGSEYPSRPVPYKSSSGTLYLQDVGGVLSFSGALSRMTIRSLDGSLSFSGALEKALKVFLTGVLSFAGALTTVFTAGPGAGSGSFGWNVQAAFREFRDFFRGEQD